MKRNQLDEWAGMLHREAISPSLLPVSTHRSTVVRGCSVRAKMSCSVCVRHCSVRLLSLLHATAAATLRNIDESTFELIDLSGLEEDWCPLSYMYMYFATLAVPVL
eukprot:4478679-Amphidinium_carterae.1